MLLIYGANSLVKLLTVGNAEGASYGSDSKIVVKDCIC